MAGRVQMGFDLEDVFEMAEQIERNGAAFYRKAARSFPAGTAAGELFLDLAAQEDRHLAVFRRLRTEILKGRRRMAAGPIAEYLRAVAGGHVFRADRSGTEVPVSGATLRGILETAIGKEKDSIVFYVSLRSTLARETDQTKLDAVIREEQKHLDELAGTLLTTPRNR